MKRICLLITKPPSHHENIHRLSGIADSAKEKGMEVAVYLLGDGVLCAKAGQTGDGGQSVRNALGKGVSVKAAENDLLARGIMAGQVEAGVEILKDFEGTFLHDVMETADRVISW